MSDRKAELERKKAKLAQIRAEKEARRKEREVADAQSAAKAAVSGIKRDERQEKRGGEKKVQAIHLSLMIVFTDMEDIPTYLGKLCNLL